MIFYYYHNIIFLVSRRDAFAGVEEEEIQSFLYDSDGCYNSSLFQASNVSAMTTFENLLNNSTMTHTVGATTTERIKERRDRANSEIQPKFDLPCNCAGGEHSQFSAQNND
jgi:hypothetical protein